MKLRRRAGRLFGWLAPRGLARLFGGVPSLKLFPRAPLKPFFFLVLQAHQKTQQLAVTTAAAAVVTTAAAAVVTTAAAAVVPTTAVTTAAAIPGVTTAAAATVAAVTTAAAIPATAIRNVDGADWENYSHCMSKGVAIGGVQLPEMHLGSPKWCSAPETAPDPSGGRLPCC